MPDSAAGSRPPRRIDVRTRDGACPTYVFRPETAVPLPAVILYMDGVGIRPALFQMGQRLAEAGYHVLLPDLFYRSGPYEPMDARTLFADPAKRAELSARFGSLVTVPKIMSDTAALLQHLAEQPEVRQPKVGVTGYCMGGRMAFAAAAHFPDRIAAAAAYHPSSLATDAADSLHLQAGQIKARIYVAAATDDANFPDAQKARLQEALQAAGVEHQVETYPARHGWVPSDTPVHDPACTERHWKTLLDLLSRSLAV